MKKSVSIILVMCMLFTLFSGVSFAQISAVPTASQVLVNGQPMSFEAYTINGNNYFKLRDLAMAVSGTSKKFEVLWDSEKNAISIVTKKVYTYVGGEMSAGDGQAKTAVLSTSKVYVDGKDKALTAYTISGNNYFKLRDVMRELNTFVGWDGTSNTITIDTSKGYVADGTEDKPADPPKETGVITAIEKKTPAVFVGTYEGNPVADSGETNFDVAGTKYGALPGNLRGNSRIVLYKDYYYVLYEFTIMKINKNTLEPKVIYEVGTGKCSFSNLQVYNDYLYWEERSYSGAEYVNTRRMKTSGGTATTIIKTYEKFTIYDGKIYSRASTPATQFEKNGFEIVRFNLDGSGKTLIYAPPEGSELVYMRRSLETSSDHLSHSGGMAPITIADDKIYFVEGVRPPSEKPGSFKRNYYVTSINLDGSNKEALGLIEGTRGSPTFSGLHKGYVYMQTNFDGLVRVPMWGGKAESVVKEVVNFTTLGSKLFYITGDEVYVANLDGSNPKYLLNMPGGYEINVVSPDYISGEIGNYYGTRADGLIYTNAFFPVNPALKDVIGFCKVEPDGGRRYEKHIVNLAGEMGIIPDGWYNISVLGNYLAINGDKETVLNNKAPLQKFKITNRGGNYYRIETEDGMVVGLKDPYNQKVNLRCSAKSKTPFDWRITIKKGGYVMQPASHLGRLLNAHNSKSANGTYVALIEGYAHQDLAKKAAWKFIPAQ